MINKYLTRIKNSTYILHIVTLLSGTLISQIIMLVFIPILTRLYSPQEFGTYSLFLIVIGIIGLISSLKYEQAIVLAKSIEDAQALVFLSVLITLGVTLLVSFVLVLFNDIFIAYFDELSHVIWVIPIGILLLGLIQILNAFASREQEYKTMSKVRVSNSITLVNIQSISKYLFEFDGLILGKLLADFLSLFLLVKLYIKKQTIKLKSLSRRRILVNAKRYENFPKYQSFTVFLNQLSQDIPILLLISLYSPEVAGLYALAIRVLQAPVSLIGGSTATVYYQRASKMFVSGQNIYRLYVKTTISLLKLFIVPFVIIFFFGEELFAFLFGEEWIESGEMSEILIVWILFLFINSPSTRTYSILNLQKLQMILQIFSVAFRFMSIYAGFYFFNDFLISVKLFVVTSVVMNIIAILIIYFKLKKMKLQEGV